MIRAFLNNPPPYLGREPEDRTVALALVDLHDRLLLVEQNHGTGAACWSVTEPDERPSDDLTKAIAIAESVFRQASP